MKSQNTVPNPGDHQWSCVNIDLWLQNLCYTTDLWSEISIFRTGPGIFWFQKLTWILMHIILFTRWRWLNMLCRHHFLHVHCRPRFPSFSWGNPLTTECVIDIHSQQEIRIYYLNREGMTILEVWPWDWYRLIVSDISIEEMHCTFKEMEPQAFVLAKSMKPEVPNMLAWHENTHSLSSLIGWRVVLVCNS